MMRSLSPFDEADAWVKLFHRGVSSMACRALDFERKISSNTEASASSSLSAFAPVFGSPAMLIAS